MKFFFQFIDKLILLYQVVVSPYNPRCCRFHPSCSHYMRQAIAQHGWYGMWLGIKRLLRCHPWSCGGVDEVPKLKRKVEK